MKTFNQLARTAFTATKAFAAAVLLLTLAPHALATPYTWNGAGDPTDDINGPPTDLDFNTGSNWDQGGVPGNGDSVYFQSNTESATLTLSADVGTSAQGLSSLDLRTQGVGLDLESSTTGSFTINMQSNSTIYFGNVGGSGATQTIGSGVTLNFTGANASGVFLDDPTYNDGGSLTINGLVTGNIGPSLQISGGNVTLTNNNNTFNGTTSSSATLYVAGGGATFTSIANAGVASALGEAANISENAGNLNYIGSGNVSTNRSLTILNASSLSNNSTTGGTINWTGTITGAALSNTVLLLGGTNSGVNTVSGLVTDSAGTKMSLVLAGENTWLLNNDNNSFSGNAPGYTFSGGSDSLFSTGVVYGGTLEFTSIANAGVNSSLGAGTGDIAVGGTLAFVGTSAQTSNRTFVVYASPFSAQTGYQFHGQIANNAASSTSSLTLTGNAFGLGNGTQVLALGGTNTGNNNFAGQILDGNGQPGGGVNDHTALVKTGQGTWVVSNPNNAYSYGTTVSQGTLVAGASSLSTTGFQTVATDGSNDITLTNNPYANGAKVVFMGFNPPNPAIPSGLNLGQVYYVINSTPNSFQIATTPNGSAVSLSQVGAGLAVAQPGVFGAGDAAVAMGDANTAGAPVSLVTNGGYTIANNINVTSYATGGATVGGIQNTGTSTFTGTLSLAQSGTLTSASGGEVDFAGPIKDSSGSNAITVNGGGVVKFTNGSNTYGGGTTVSGDLTTLLLNNTSGTEALGTGPLVVKPGGTIGGSGNASGLSSFTIGASGSKAQVIVGNGGNDTVSHLILAATGASTITNANLKFNLSSLTLGQSNVLDLGSTPLTVSNTTLSLDIIGNGNITLGTPYLLITDTNGWSTANGLTFGSDGQITGGLSIAAYGGFGTPVNGYTTGLYPDSYLFVNGDGIYVDFVPEPSTWALLLGGVATLLMFQRTRRNSKTRN